jgi:hypothetical protein
MANRREFRYMLEVIANAFWSSSNGGSFSGRLSEFIRDIDLAVSGLIPIILYAKWNSGYIIETAYSNYSSEVAEGLGV